MFDYVNLIYWLFALASLIAWARFATFMAEDVTKNLVDQRELPWKLAAGGVMLLMLIVYLTMPSFWLSVPINALIVGSMIALFWTVRVRALGSKGHLLRGAIEAAGKASTRMEERKNARQVQLTYLRHDNTPMPLPSPSDPLAAGLGTADAIVIQALMRRAEIVDLMPSATGYSLTLVTDSVPSSQPAADRALAEAAIQAFKVLSGLSAEERRRPQVGSFRSRDAEGTTTVWTVRTSGSMVGERAILTANEQGQWNLSLEQLGLTSEQLADMKKIAADTRGVVIVAGPRGSGRTATLYALLRQHDAFTNSVQTLELNPQTEIEGVTINRFDGKAEQSFSKALQSIMLKEPNVLLVSQIPDGPTADLITKYAGESESHRILTTLPAPDSFGALEMWLNINSNKSAAANALRAVISQRLVRILCPTCKIPYQPDEATLKRLNMPMGRNLQSFKANMEPLIDRKGNKITCPDCGGVGFRGRTGIFEILIINDEIKQAMASGANMNQIRALARKNNLMFLVEHGIRKFAAGITAINEVTRVMSPPTAAAGRSGIMESQK